MLDPKTVFQVKNPDGVVFTLTISLTLGEWRRIFDNIETRHLYPMSEIAEPIQSMVRQARESFVPLPSTVPDFLDDEEAS